LLNLTDDTKDFGNDDVTLTTTILENIVEEKEFLNEVMQ
jgi:hypothetical protein